jgi:diaminohydroxyphosphoribosylaminopyrimidine deaminase/5-amino-6-(5-phosphoribosylamino)uracil reductase
MTSSKTVNIDNPKLNCRIKGFEKFSPVRIILDKNLNLNKNTYIFKSAKKKNTIVFYNKANKSRISMFKKKKIELIKAKLINNKRLDLRTIMKKLYFLGFRNTLVEGGDILTTSLLKNKIFNEFYLFKSPKKLPTNSDFVKFNGLNVLNKKYLFKHNLNSSYGKDTITLYNK